MRKLLLIAATAALTSCGAVGPGTSLYFDPVTGTWQVRVDLAPPKAEVVQDSGK